MAQSYKRILGGWKKERNNNFIYQNTSSSLHLQLLGRGVGRGVQHAQLGERPHTEHRSPSDQSGRHRAKVTRVS